MANTFPVNGLNTNGGGHCNEEHVQLIPHSLSGGKCHSGSDLTIENNTLVGKHGHDSCKGAGLVGASFVVRGLKSANVTFSITDVRPTKHSNRETEFEGYQIEVDHQSACNPIVAAKIRSDLGLDPVPSFTNGVVTPPPPDDNSNLVIAVGPPIYSAIMQPIPSTDGPMFNLACADDSLAKRSFDNLVSSNEDRNTDSLRMLTATYCDRPYTVPGVDLDWTKMSAAVTDLNHEATWDHGATKCLDHPRLAYLKDGNGNAVEPKDFPLAVLPPGCDKGENCSIDRWKENVLAECATKKKVVADKCSEFVAGYLDSYTDKISKAPKPHGSIRKHDVDSNAPAY